MRCTRIIAALAVAAVLSACGDDNDDASIVTVHFDHQVAGSELHLDPTTMYTNAAGNIYSVSLLEYIVTDIDLVTHSGSTHRLRAAHYRSAANPTTADFTALDVPAGDYEAVRFVFGVHGDNNTLGALPNTTHYNNMEWPAPMGGGYHYMRLEGLYSQSGQAQAFLSHTGPTGGGDFSIAVELPLTLHLDGDDAEIHLVMDINEWFEAPFIYDFAGQGGIMGNADAQLTHQANGVTVFSVGSAGSSDHEHENEHDE